MKDDRWESAAVIRGQIWDRHTGLVLAEHERQRDEFVKEKFDALGIRFLNEQR